MPRSGSVLILLESLRSMTDVGRDRAGAGIVAMLCELCQGFMLLVHMHLIELLKEIRVLTHGKA